MKIKVYDFDKTIYDGDSTLDFYLYCLRRFPKIVIYLPRQLYGFMLYILGKYSKVQFKEVFFSFVQSVDNIDSVVREFWQKNSCKLKKWYVNKNHDDDVIISASPEFLLEPICQKRRVKRLIASRVDKYNGKFTGDNCYGEEKVKRLDEEIDGYKIEEFYSDSLSDTPLAKLAKESYLVCGNKLIKWWEYEPSRMKKIKDMFVAADFVMFIIIGTINALNGVLFAYGYSFFLADNLAFIVGYISSLTISYFLNSKFTFKKRLTLKRYFKFCISYIPNFIIQNVIVVIFLNILGWYKLIVFALAAIIGTPITFILMKIFAFKR